MPDKDPLTYISREKKQVNVTINNNFLLDWAPFYHFYSGLRKRRNVSQFLMGCHQILTAPR